VSISHRLTVSRTLVLTAASTLVAALLTTVTATAAAASPPASAGTSPTGSRTVDFAGVSVRVPAAWPVIDVDGVPGCVRYDQHAVYLGEPSESTCPARVIGGVGTVQIVRGLSSGAQPTAPIVRVDADGHTSVALGRTATPRVIVTADPADPTLAGSIAASTTIDGATVGPVAVADARTVVDATVAHLTSGAPTASGRTSTTPTAPTTSDSSSDLATTTAAVPAPVTFSGKAFDTCTAPTQTQMTAWQSSPYDGVGIYVGGISMGCKQPELTPSWVTTQRQRGWHLLPIYVPVQASCAKTSSGDPFPHRMSSNATTAATQGTNAANNAIGHMNVLGIGAAGNPIYLDLESWDTTNTTCTKAAMAFTNAWTVALHQAGYLSGFYSSAGTGVAALVNAVQHQSGFHAPDAVWFARYVSKIDDNVTMTDPAIPAGLWANHQRARQYFGGHYETHGGRTINIDSDVVDGPVVPTLPTLTTASLPNAVPNESYSTTVRAQGGVTPYSFSVTSGTLPAGLKLGTGGKLFGTATTMAAPVSVTITVTDARGATASQRYSIAVTFIDVPTKSGFFDDIAWLANGGVTSGYSDGTFRPRASVSRQSMAAFLYRYAHDGAKALACTTAPFSDVPVGSQFCGAIAWLKAERISTGNADGTFGPTAIVVRQSMAAFLYRYAHGGADAGACTGSPPFPDVSAQSVFCGDIAWLKAEGISTGNADGTFGPNTAVSRQAMAAFLYRLNTAAPS